VVAAIGEVAGVAMIAADAAIIEGVEATIEGAAATIAVAAVGATAAADPVDQQACVPPALIAKPGSHRFLKAAGQ